MIAKSKKQSEKTFLARDAYAEIMPKINK